MIRCEQHVVHEIRSHSDWCLRQLNNHLNPK